MVGWPLYRLGAMATMATMGIGLFGCQAIFGVDADEGAGGGGGGSGESQCGDGVCAKSENCLDCPQDCARNSCNDNLESNDASLDASEIDPNRERCGLGICQGDQDWFVLDVPTDTHVRIRYDASQGDLDLEIYDSDYVDGSYTEGAGEDKVPLGQLAAGPYEARVYGKSDEPEIVNTCYCIRIAAGE